MPWAIRALGSSVIVRHSSRRRAVLGSSKLWSLLSLIDQLHAADAHIPSCLGLDEQFYRLLCLCLLESTGRFEQVRKRRAASPQTWSDPLDELVDYIRTNAHENLTMTDLEARSNYSARHLQTLFKQKLGCTPMQFVRRQRLSAAMARLERADWDDSVTTIARDCGYRYVSSFSSDFREAYGVKPSSVLRASRRQA